MIDVRDQLRLASGQTTTFCSLPLLEKRGMSGISRLPVSIRVMLESLVRNADGKRIREQDVEALARWQPNGARTSEVPFVVGRVLLQDFTGVPLVVDLAAMRAAIVRTGRDPLLVKPVVPVDLVIDHSVQVDFFGTEQAFAMNVKVEMERNQERYAFLKWGMQAFDGLRIVPPGFGICHQVNLEFLARGVLQRDGVSYPDSLVGTDSHTTMINGLGILGWGVGGIEAEAAMLNQPIYLLTPDVVGVHMSGRLKPGVTATDLVLRVTEMLRKAKVVGKLVEFFGEGAEALSVPDRATVSNMAPEYGATCGFFPVDEESARYFRATGRTDGEVDLFRRYHQAQGMFGMPKKGQCDYSTLLELELGEIEPSVSGPRRPQDRIELGSLKEKFLDLLKRTDATGYAKGADQIGLRLKSQVSHPMRAQAGGGQQDSGTVPLGKSKGTNTLTEIEMMDNRPTPDRMPDGAGKKVGTDQVEIGHGSVVIAAITSCTNTSNPSVMLGAGILAKKAVERGLEVPLWVKTSLAPGSRAVSEYLKKTGLQPYLDQLGFNLVGYGCTTCIGNSGPLDRDLEDTITQKDIIAASVLSGNRNFEARVHQSVKANFLMSPPLVVAFALAGRVDIDLNKEPIGTGRGKPVFLADIWPTPEEIQRMIESAFDPAEYRRIYGGFASQNALWNQIETAAGHSYSWDQSSTYIREPPYFMKAMAAEPVADVRGARCLAIFGDSVTTDHISPAGSIKPDSPAGKYLRELGVQPVDFNSYGARRGNHEVMVRGTFANVRIKNLMLPGVEGGVTLHQPDQTRMTIYDAANRYRDEKASLVVIAGRDYGTGSSRDWAAKGTRLLGVRAVIARSFERIHRSNLVGMGVLPLQLAEADSSETLKLDGTETFDITGIGAELKPLMQATLVIHRKDGKRDSVPLTVRIDTPIEVEYFRSGGILPFVMNDLLRA